LFREMQNGFAHSEIICDAQGRPVNSRYLAVNPAFERITGRPAASVVGNTILEVFPALEPGWLEAFGRVALTGEPAQFEMRAAELGITFDVAAFQPAPNQYACTFSDITARKQAEEGIRQLNAELEQRVRDRTVQLEAANRELEAFSYSVSHDLRAPLRHVHGYVEMLTRELGGQLSDKARRFLQTISAASGEMGVLIDDLLEFSRMGRTEMRDASVELDLLVQEARRDLARATPQRTIIWKIPPLPVVQGDPAMLKQVLVNLLGNAVKYTRPRDPAEIEVGCAGEEDGRIILFVRDNGVGFDPRYAHKLFGVFQRLHRADEFEGTGIGLASVRRIIARHGGRTWAEGAVDQGATFYFTLRQSNE
jgi:PAS domain S-box-containing protein